MALFVIRNLLGQLRHEVRALGTWSDEVHVAFEDVPELRNLVYANLADDAADASGAVVTLRSPDRALFFCIDVHRTKLHQHKRPPILANAFLLVKNRATRLELDEYRGHDDDRQREKEPNQRCETVNHDTSERREFFVPARPGEDQPGWAHHAQRNAPGNSLVKRRAFFDPHAAGKA